MVSVRKYRKLAHLPGRKSVAAVDSVNEDGCDDRKCTQNTVEVDKDQLPVLNVNKLNEVQAIRNIIEGLQCRLNMLLGTDETLENESVEKTCLQGLQSQLHALMVNNGILDEKLDRNHNYYLQKFDSLSLQLVKSSRISQNLELEERMKKLEEKVDSLGVPLGGTLSRTCRLEEETRMKTLEEKVGEIKELFTSSHQDAIDKITLMRDQFRSYHCAKVEKLEQLQQEMMKRSEEQFEKLLENLNQNQKALETSPVSVGREMPSAMKKLTEQVEGITKRIEAIGKKNDKDYNSQICPCKNLSEMTGKNTGTKNSLSKNLESEIDRIDCNHDDIQKKVEQDQNHNDVMNCIETLSFPQVQSQTEVSQHLGPEVEEADTRIKKLAKQAIKNRHGTMEEVNKVMRNHCNPDISGNLDGRKGRSGRGEKTPPHYLISTEKDYKHSPASQPKSHLDIERVAGPNCEDQKVECEPDQKKLKLKFIVRRGPRPLTVAPN